MNTVDRLMMCCGVVGAYGFDRYVIVKDPKNPLKAAEVRVTEEQSRARYRAVFTRQLEDERNCAIIFLSSDQQEELKIAQEEGFKIIQEFWNPNSGNKVYILTHIRWATKDDYEEDYPPERDYQDSQ